MSIKYKTILALNNQGKNQGKKLHNLFQNNSYHNLVTSHDPGKVTFNFSGHALNTTEKSLLSK